MQWYVRLKASKDLIVYVKNYLIILETRIRQTRLEQIEIKGFSTAAQTEAGVNRGDKLLNRICHSKPL